jgi:hypothetical protein
MKVVIRLSYQIMFVTIGYFLLGCTSNTQIHEAADAEVTKAQSPPPRSTTAAVVAKSIRSVDFGNFTYPWHKDLINPQNPQKSFTLRNGELPQSHDNSRYKNEMGVHLVTTIYGDTTADGIEEAIVVLGIITGGSSIPHCIYIYSWRNNEPFLLWSSVTGDRADDGLRTIRIENGKVLIEIYSPVDKKADCCPKYFRRLWLTWVGNKFKQEKQEELLPNVEGHGSPIF